MAIAWSLGERERKKKLTNSTKSQCRSTKMAPETKKYVENSVQFFGEKKHKSVPHASPSHRRRRASRTILEISKQESGVRVYYNTDELRSRDAKNDRRPRIYITRHTLHVCGIENYRPMLRFARVDFRSEVVSRESRELVLISSSLSIPTIHRWRARNIYFCRDTWIGSDVTPRATARIDNSNFWKIARPNARSTSRK